MIGVVVLWGPHIYMYISVKDERGEVELCPLQRQQAQELSSRPPKEHVGQGNDTAFETYVSALDDVIILTSIALYRAQGSPSIPNGTPANSSLHQPYLLQGSGYDWLLSLRTHDKWVSRPVSTHESSHGFAD